MKMHYGIIISKLFNYQKMQKRKDNKKPGDKFSISIKLLIMT